MPCGHAWSTNWRLPGHELTFSQYVTLKMLSNGPAGVTDLARFAELNPGAMTRLLDKLEAKGIIARVADPADRRA
jgi:DNA-binding MarR family transcriptional regulator